MGRKQPASSAQLASVEPEPKDSESAAAVSPSTSQQSKNADVSEASAEPSKASTVEQTADTASETPSTKTEVSKTDPRAEAEPKPVRETAEEERPPPPPRPKPERRVSGFSSNLGELKTAFPEAAEGILRAVLVAASNNLEAAFTGMLAMSDATIRPAAYINEQIERDARLARRLAESETRSGRRVVREPHVAREARRPISQDDLGGDELYDGFQRGISDTKQVVSSFWGSLKQRLSNEVYDEDDLYANSDRDREPARDQWWPRQSSSSSSSRAIPPLPPRKSSASTTPNRPMEPRTKEAKDAAPEPRSVNAFGDESAAQRKQWEPVQADEPEPDAFFIGESDDDDDLGSLNEEPFKSTAEGRLAGTKPAVGDDVNNKSTDVKPENVKVDTSNAKVSTGADKNTDLKEEPKSKDEDESVDARERRASTAKDLLNKLKLEAGEKGKGESD